MRAALYIRLSKEDEGDGPSQSVQNQEAMLRAFAAQRGIDIAGVYIDDGWSGSNFDRPAFRRMTADIEDGKVDTVVTKDLSRLGRDYILTGHYMERYFPEHRVRYISLLDGIDTGVDSTANDITPFRAIMNDMYAKDISKKIRSVKHDKQRRGLFIGGKALFGYKKHPTEKNRLIVDQEAAATVRRVFSMAAAGMSCRAIASELNRTGVPTPSEYAHLTSAKGRLWSSERVSEMLQNETYTGSMVQGRRRRVSYKSKKCVRIPPEDWAVVSDTHEAIIDRASFERVQHLLGARRHTRCRTYDYKLRGLIFCRECGKPLAVINRRNSKGEDRLFFVCRTYQRFTREGACSCHCAKVEAVTDAVLAGLLALCRAHIDMDGLLREAENMILGAGERGGAGTRLREAEAKLAGIGVHIDRLYADRLSGLLAEEDFRRIYGALLLEREQLEGQRAGLISRGGTREEPGELAAKLVRDFMDGGLASREALVELIERVELSEDREVRVKLRFHEL